MIAIRKAGDRGHAEHGWLDTWHTFSFADYYDPENMGFRGLRVINDDRVAAGQGFGMHPHRDMEIVTYILDGELEHKDSMGNGAVMRRGELQRMSAGRGVLHSEFNPSKKAPLHLLQIWIVPAERGIQPSYEQKLFPPEERQGKLKLVAAPGGPEGAFKINADAELRLGLLGPGEKARHDLRPGRHAWVHVAKGAAKVNGHALEAGDGAAFSGEAAVELEGVSGPADLLVFDLA